MENLRYLLVAIAALTLVMSVVSGVNPNYFAGLSAFADHEEEEEDEDNSGSNDDHEEEDEGGGGPDHGQDGRVVRLVGGEDRGELPPPASRRRVRSKTWSPELVISETMNA